jgi:DNA-binding PadR family transcriptional regulator
MPQDRIGGEILKGHIGTMVLSVVGDRSRHGYEIMKILSERSEGVFELRQGTIYPMLYALEEEGLIRSRDETVDGRRRRMYSLTAAGKKRLSEKKATWRVFVAAVNNVLEPARMGVVAHEAI